MSEPKGIIFSYVLKFSSNVDNLSKLRSDILEWAKGPFHITISNQRLRYRAQAGVWYQCVVSYQSANQRFPKLKRPLGILKSFRRVAIR